MSFSIIDKRVPYDTSMPIRKYPAYDGIVINFSGFGTIYGGTAYVQLIGNY